MQVILTASEVKMEHPYLFCLNVDAQQCNICFVFTCWSTLRQRWVHNEMYYNCKRFASSVYVSLLLHIMPYNVTVAVIILRNVAANYMNYKTSNNEGHTPCRMYQRLFHYAKHSLHVIIWRALTTRTVPAGSLIRLVWQTIDAECCHVSVT
jgi:hypothetical protein